MATDNNSNSNSKSHRPDLSPLMVTSLTCDLYGLHVQSYEELESYGDRNYHVIVDAQNVSNYFLGEVCPDGYVLKVLNSEDSMNVAAVKTKDEVVEHVHTEGFPTARLVPTVTGHLSRLCSLHTANGKQRYGVIARDDVIKYAVRLLEYIPGTVLSAVPLTPRLSFQVGSFAARLDGILQGFDNKNSVDLSTNWSMENLPFVRQLLYVINDVSTKRVCSDVIDAFETEVITNKDKKTFRRGIVHTDFNPNNILVHPTAATTQNPPSFPTSSAAASSKTLYPSSTSPSFTSSSSSSSSSGEKWDVSAVLDFGDACETYVFLEAAIAMSHLMLDCPPGCDPDELAGHTLAGYLSQIKLSRTEVELLPIAICARLCQLVVCGNHTLTMDPGNRDYVLAYVTPALRHLLRSWGRPRDVRLSKWKDVAERWKVKFPE
ncbi:hydroxylysine kinase-like [Littorina saxatilis]|uniref:hydroxylysine kinase-like n=1 Tax=Littorina saxatilis TaxID=31220 RepID=UPI0038B57232